MTGGHVRGALAVGIADADEDAARRALAVADPVARRLARRRLERYLLDAALACDAAALRPAPPDHVMRVAALAVAGRPAPDAGDLAAVTAAYAALGPAAIPRAPVMTVLAGLLAAAVIGVIALLVVLRPAPPSRTYARPLPPPSAQAFVTGGVPLTDPAIDALLAAPLTALVVQGGRARDGKDHTLPVALAAVRAPRALAGQPPAVRAAWDAMVDTFTRSVEAAARPGGPTPREHDELVEGVRELSQALLGAGLGYHLEGRFKSGYPYVQAYRVEEVVFVEAGGARRRVLSLRRADRLNLRWTALGLHDADVGDPVLLLEQIDTSVASTVLPVLAAGTPYPLADREWMTWPANRTLATTIGDAVRREYAAALGTDAAATAEVAALLVTRGAIIDEWRDKLERGRFYVIETDGLFVPPALLAELEGKVLTSQRDKVAALDARIAAVEGPRLHARVLERVAATVRRHEAQHGFDYDRDTELRYPPQLQDLLGAPHDGEGNPRAIVRSARAELSAYLSQIANDLVTPHAALWQLIGHLMHRDRWGTGESYAAMVVLEALAAARHVELAGPRYARGVNRERLVPALTALAAMPTADLREAATAAWTALYGEPLTMITDAPAPPAVTP